MHRTVVPLSGFSTVFDDYPAESRARLEGKFTLIELYVPNEFASHLRLGQPVVVEADEVSA